MTQAINRATRACSVEQAVTLDDLNMLKGLSALLSFVASGAENLGGQPVWEALRLLDEKLATVVERIDDSAERVRRRQRRAEPVRTILETYWSGFGAGEDGETLKSNPHQDSPDLYVAWVAGWRQSELQSRI